MGKGRHASDRLYENSAEAGRFGAAAAAARHESVKALPFTHCALTLAPWETPMMAPDGVVFELTQIVPWLRKRGVHPVGGAPLAARDLVALKYARNADGECICPVTARTFTAHSRIAAVRTTGNVYAWEALQELCLGPKSFRDLLDDTPFAGRADIVMLHDPQDAAPGKA